VLFSFLQLTIVLPNQIENIWVFNSLMVDVVASCYCCWQWCC